MKKLVKSVMMLSIASLAILSSCKKEDENATVTDVKVDVTSSPASVREGGVVTLTVTCTGNTDNNLDAISVTRTGGSLASKTVLSTSLSGTSATKTIVDTLGSGTYTYTVAVTGKTGSPATKTITVATVPAPKELDITNPIPLFGSANGAGTNAHFLQLSDPFTTVSTANFSTNKSKIDVAFYYGSNNKATLTSPSDNVMQGLFTGLDWTSGINITSLYKTSMTLAQFDAIAASNSDSAITAMAATVTTWTSSVNLLSVNNVILYKTAANKVGLIKVDNISGKDNTDAEISLRIIAQKN